MNIFHASGICHLTMFKLLYVFALLHFMSVRECTRRFERSRRKRVVNGYIPVVNRERTFDYEVIRYSAWIGAATSCTSYKKVKVDTPKWWVASGRQCFPDVDDQRCMGALIHPRIVQTAGHCVGSHVFSVDDPAQAWAPGKVWSVWEGMLQIFVGYTDVEDFRHPLYSRFFIQHPKYAQLRDPQYAWVTHDFGWIILNSEAPRLEHWSNLVAPVMTSATLKRETAALLKNEEVCLFAGFGAWQYTDKEILNTTSSRFLRYGWQLTTSYQQCWYFTYVLTEGWKIAQNKWKYKQYATWFCHVPFGDHLMDHPGFGDSGGPVHCNGKMLALVSGGEWQKVTLDGSERAHITRTMGLFYSTFENVADFRGYFVATLKYYGRVRQLYFTRRRKHRHRHEIKSAVIRYSLKSENSGNAHVPCSFFTVAFVLMTWNFMVSWVKFSKYDTNYNFSILKIEL